MSLILIFQSLLEIYGKPVGETRDVAITCGFTGCGVSATADDIIKLSQAIGEAIGSFLGAVWENFLHLFGH